MKIDNILAKHPWPWRVETQPSKVWTVVDNRNRFVFDCGGVDDDERDAFLELVEAHVNKNKKPKP